MNILKCRKKNPTQFHSLPVHCFSRHPIKEHHCLFKAQSAASVNPRGSPVMRVLLANYLDGEEKDRMCENERDQGASDEWWS